MRKSMRETLKNSRLGKLRALVEKGEIKCKYCDEPAKYLSNNYYVCCSKTAKECPGYHNWLSEHMKEKYKNNPELVDEQRRIGKEVHNRPNVIESKSNTMIMLHHGDCEPCKEFQKNYKEGQAKRRGLPLRLSDRIIPEDEV